MDYSILHVLKCSSLMVSPMLQSKRFRCKLKKIIILRLHLKREINNFLPAGSSGELDFPCKTVILIVVQILQLLKCLQQREMNPPSQHSEKYGAIPRQGHRWSFQFLEIFTVVSVSWKSLQYCHLRGRTWSREGRCEHILTSSVSWASTLATVQNKWMRLVIRSNSVSFCEGLCFCMAYSTSVSLEWIKYLSLLPSSANQIPFAVFPSHFICNF